MTSAEIFPGMTGPMGTGRIITDRKINHGDRWRIAMSSVLLEAFPQLEFQSYPHFLILWIFLTFMLNCLWCQNHMVFIIRLKIKQRFEAQGTQKPKNLCKIQQTPGSIFCLSLWPKSFRTCTLITHGTFSNHGTSANTYHWVDVELVPVSWNIPSGQYHAVAIDTQDPLYTQPTLEKYTINIQHQYNKHSYLELEIEN